MKPVDQRTTKTSGIAADQSEPPGAPDCALVAIDMSPIGGVVAKGRKCLVPDPPWQAPARASQDCAEPRRRAPSCGLGVDWRAGRPIRIAMRRLAVTTLLPLVLVAAA